MSVKLEVLFLETLKKPNIFHHRGKAQNLNFNSYVYIHIINSLSALTLYLNFLLIS